MEIVGCLLEARTYEVATDNRPAWRAEIDRAIGAVEKLLAASRDAAPELLSAKSAFGKYEKAMRGYYKQRASEAS